MSSSDKHEDSGKEEPEGGTPPGKQGAPRRRSASLSAIPDTTVPTPLTGRVRSHSFTALSAQQRQRTLDNPRPSVSTAPLSAPAGMDMAVDHPDFLGYTGREHEFKTPVHVGPFKFSVVGQVSPEVALHYGLRAPGMDEHQRRGETDEIGVNEHSDHPDFWGYTGREHEFKTPVHVGPFKFSVAGQVSPEVALHYGLDRHVGEGGVSRQPQDVSSGQGSPAPVTSQSKMKLGLGPAKVGGIFGEIVMARLAKRAIKETGKDEGGAARGTGDAATHRTAPGGEQSRVSGASAGNPVDHRDFLGFTGREHEFKTPVRAGPFKFSVIGNISPEVARHYGIDRPGLEGRKRADQPDDAVTAKTRGAQPAVGQGKMKLSFGPAKVGGVFGEIVTAKLAQRAMKQLAKTRAPQTAAGEKAQAGGKSKPVKFKLSVTPHIGGLLGDRVTAKLALRARKQAAKSAPAPSSSAKKSSS